MFTLGQLQLHLAPASTEFGAHAPSCNMASHVCTPQGTPTNVLFVWMPAFVKLPLQAPDPGAPATSSRPSVNGHVMEGMAANVTLPAIS